MDPGLTITFVTIAARHTNKNVRTVATSTLIKTLSVWVNRVKVFILNRFNVNNKTNVNHKHIINK